MLGVSLLLCSWLGKIQVVKELLVDNSEKARPGLDALAYAYIYLQVTFLSPQQSRTGHAHNTHALHLQNSLLNLIFC